MDFTPGLGSDLLDFQSFSLFLYRPLLGPQPLWLLCLPHSCQLNDIWKGTWHAYRDQQCVHGHRKYRVFLYVSVEDSERILEETFLNCNLKDGCISTTQLEIKDRYKDPQTGKTNVRRELQVTDYGCSVRWRVKGGRSEVEVARARLRRALTSFSLLSSGVCIYFEEAVA